jgi:hypothetical protein
MCCWARRELRGHGLLVPGRKTALPGVWFLALLGVWFICMEWAANHLLGAIASQVTDGPVPAKNEVVMTPGMQITATTPTGTITVTAGQGLLRSYTWEGATRSVEMEPRSERWHGSLGLYFPGPGYHWEEHNGVARAVVEEGQQHFETSEEAVRWIAAHSCLSPVYRNDGLVVAWGKSLPRKQLDVEVWQVYIGGKKPSRLPGSQDEAIRVQSPP